MVNSFLQLEFELRLAGFSGTLCAILVWEFLATKRPSALLFKRTLTHFLLMIINSLALRLVMPILAFELALHVEVRELGLLPHLPAPEFAKVLISLIVLDLAIYTQHVMFHKVPFLWRFHRVHHADTGFDVTTGFRFHPGEIIFSMIYKLALVLLLGPSALTILIFEILLSSASLFTHANAGMPRRVDSLLRLIIVTPDMHRIHHSRQADEALTNFGFNLSLWDRIFKTYRVDPSTSHAEMNIGTKNISVQQAASFGAMLALPLHKQ